MADVTAVALDDLPNGPFSGAQTFFARRGLGVSSFGMQVWRFPANYSEYPQHDEADAQEEVYVGLSGEATITAAGEEHTITQGVFVRVAPGVHRNITTGSTAAEILALGATPGQAYVAPSWT
jgi:quercetin dioxygenase-like cupin family protein